MIETIGVEDVPYNRGIERGRDLFEKIAVCHRACSLLGFKATYIAFCSFFSQYRTLNQKTESILYQFSRDQLGLLEDRFSCEPLHVEWVAVLGQDALS
jgi:hypothetical protein